MLKLTNITLAALLFSLMAMSTIGCSGGGGGGGGNDNNTEDNESGDYAFTMEKLSLVTDTPSYVNIMFRVSNTDGQPIPWLETEDFKVEEDDSEVSPTESAMRVRKKDEIPYTLYTVLMLDNSLSVGSNLEDIIGAAVQLIYIADAPMESDRDGDTENQLFMVYSFSDSPDQLTPLFTNDVAEIVTAIESIELGYNSTDLYGAVVDGVSQWSDYYTINDISQGFLVLLTDGSDTQGSSTLSQAMSARGSKKVITLGVGEEIEPDVMEQLGNAGFFQIDDYVKLEAQFIEIQEYMQLYANSFFWLDYLSPKRGDINHELVLLIEGNENIYEDGEINGQFNSKDFYSVLPGIYINASADTPMGIDTIMVPEQGSKTIMMLVYLDKEGGAPKPPVYTVTADDYGTVVDITLVSESQCMLTAVGSTGESCTITITDAANDFTKTATINIVPIDYFFSLPFTKSASNPVLEYGGIDTWEGQSIGNPTVLYLNSTYHMWYTGFGSYDYRIGHATSPDGITWTKYANNPVLVSGSSGNWDDNEISGPSVLYDGTTYHMWYTGQRSGFWDWRIGHATSPDGITWTKDTSNPVLDLGSSGTWEDEDVTDPSVLYDGSAYHMWYSGYDGSNWRIGHAISPDGITWTKDTSNPVLDLGSSGNWDDRGVNSPSVLHDGTTYHMWYSGFKEVSGSWAYRIGYAKSADGFTWTRGDNNPVVESDSGWDYDKIFNPTVYCDGANCRMWYAGTSLTNYNIGLAILE